LVLVTSVVLMCIFSVGQAVKGKGADNITVIGGVLITEEDVPQLKEASLKADEGIIKVSAF